MRHILSRAVMVGTLLTSAFSPVHAERTIMFSGYRWTVRHTTQPEGPGPNRFSDDPRSVRVDEEGALHLRVRRDRGEWRSAEVRLPDALGYGTYLFETSDALVFDSPSVILGLFTFDHDAPERWYREIDIEFGRFGNVRKPEGQFALHPFELPNHRHEFRVPTEATATHTHGFQWTEERIKFRSATGSQPRLFELEEDHTAMYAEWSITGPTVPDPGNARVHINLWLYEARSPASEQEAVIRSFTHEPPASVETSETPL